MTPSRHGRERGASLTEYAALIALLAVLVGGLVFFGVADRISQGISGAVAGVFGDDEQPGDDSPEQDPEEAPEEAPEEEGDDCFLLNPFCWGGDDEPDPNEEEIHDLLEETEIGRDALEHVEEHGVDVDYVEDDGTCVYRSSSGEIEIDVSRSPEGAAGCFVHEVDHSERDIAGERPEPGDYDDKDEYLRAMAEFEGNARIIQIEFHQELRAEVDEATERHSWETMYEDAYEEGGRDAVLERFVEAYMDEEPGASSYRETWEERWEDEHSCTDVLWWCI